MAFPVSIDGCVSVKVPSGAPLPTEAALHALVDGLERLRASTIKREGHQILFAVRLLRAVLNTNLLVPVEGGAIQVDVLDGTLKVTYRLLTVRILVIGSAAALLPIIILADQGIQHSLQVSAIFWAFLFGGNYFLAAMRFRWFVKRTVEKASDSWMRSARNAQNPSLIS